MQRRSFDFDSALVRRICVGLASLACCLIVAAAQAQQPQPPQDDVHSGSTVPPAPGQPPETPSPGNRPGFLDALNRLFGDPKGALDSQMRSTQETLGSIGNQAKDAAGSVVAIPGTRVITGRQLCPPASNGAPDCQQGVETLCRAKGFQGGGRTIDVTSAQRCPAKVWISGRGPNEGDCKLETYVTRAVCQ